MLLLAALVGASTNNVLKGVVDGGGSMRRIDVGLPKVAGDVKAVRWLAIGHLFGPRHLDALLLMRMSPEHARDVDSQWEVRIYEQQPESSFFQAWRPSTSVKYAAEPKWRHPLPPGIVVRNALIIDVNHDGLAEVVLTVQSGESVSVEIYSLTDDSKDLTLWQTLGPFADEPAVVDLFGRQVVDFVARVTNQTSQPSVEVGVWKGEAPMVTLAGRKFFGPATSYRHLPASSVPSSMCAASFYAVADFDGDGVADLLLLCSSSTDDSKNGDRQRWRYQIWTGRGRPDEFPSLGQEGQLPSEIEHVDSVHAVDVDGDASVDLIVASKDMLYVLYNQQRPFCTGLPGEPSNCKRPKTLFAADATYGFDDGLVYSFKLPVEPNRHDPLSAIKGLMAGVTVGDLDADGFPDAAFVGVDGQLYILRNKPGDAYSQHPMRRQFAVLVPDDLSKVRQQVDPDAKSNLVQVQFVHLSPHGFPDLVVHSQSDVVVVKNELSRDVYFVRTQVFNGVCHRQCRSDRRLQGRTDSSTGPIGGGTPGPTVRYHFSDIDGVTRVRVMAQLPVTGQRRLSLPFVAVGLGRINSFVEELCVATPTGDRFTRQHVLPNSHLSAFPPSGDEQHWRLQLYINPADYSMWVGVSVLLAVAIFAGIAGAFKLRERWEDGRERQRQASATPGFFRT